MKKIILISLITGLTLPAAYSAKLSDFDGYTSVKIISGNSTVNAIPTDRTQYDLTCNEIHGDFSNGRLNPNSYEICQPSNGNYSAVLPIQDESGAMCSITLSRAVHKIVLGSKGCPMAQQYQGSVYSEGNDDNKRLIIDFSKVDS
ncbi:hypothetical protein LO80_09610 [Candidatus Francisella endociliophora]|uniref:Uncharacterized protein n=1 Tax=Candidatus Francisella endociliophora TaxID=653937 RepID=A0A097ERK3_9GAMM|nr:hypothetical protein [Francisella sp. FSC1006]AIT10200.1 hypothetical protein LO80_09610 [Francisella sp. FSC1006]